GLHSAQSGVFGHTARLTKCFDDGDPVLQCICDNPLLDIERTRWIPVRRRQGLSPRSVLSLPLNAAGSQRVLRSLSLVPRAAKYSPDSVGPYKQGLICVGA